MTRLPVIVGFGGVNAAGRSSAHHAYRRMVFDALAAESASETVQALASLMNLQKGDVDGQRLDDGSLREAVLANTLIRRISPDHYDVDQIPWNRRLSMVSEGSEGISFVVSNKHLPDRIPSNWAVESLDARQSRVVIADGQDVLVPDSRQSAVRAAGQLPEGFDPKALYQSRNHPRGLQMTVFGASDALGQLGIDWDLIQSKVPADQISVYAGSGMSQLDLNGNGGMMASRANGKRVTSKQCPFGFAEMPADFINAYILGSLGSTGTSMGACASFLYNLRMGLNDIQTGKARVVIVGNAEAPITPEIMEGYAAMGALATDAELMALDGSDVADHRRACRPFSSNCGFTIAESAQFIVLFDDALAIELGATIYGGVSDVFVNADGHKKSISAPGVGNYITFAKAAGAIKSLLGEESLRQRSFVQAHGTGTPQNRITESHIINETAKAFGIESWPVAAIKNFLGHSIGAAAGDQIIASLGVWQYGLIPGISSIDHIADDVHASHLNFSIGHHDVGAKGMDAAIINAKGFGGNNATANILAPHIVEKMLTKRYGAAEMAAYYQRNEAVRQAAEAYDKAMTAGTELPVYKFDHNVLVGDDVELSDNAIKIPGYEHKIDLQAKSAYSDLI